MVRVAGFEPAMQFNALRPKRSDLTRLAYTRINDLFVVLSFLAPPKTSLTFLFLSYPHSVFTRRIAKIFCYNVLHDFLSIKTILGHPIFRLMSQEIHFERLRHQVISTSRQYSSSDDTGKL
ncbi:hypothetical protein RsoM2USA_176 [Ralstonia phage RsoM2USA]|nr:hypothetical protein RsoM2USA_176 [Ralstonia phage RsoM2USA]